MSDLTDAVLRAVAAEREHQDAEGNGPGHDDEHHGHGELAIAAAAMVLSGTDFAIDHEEEQPGYLPHLIAWGYANKYADNRERQLLIAAAWCVAELERLLREKQRGAVLPALEKRFKWRKPAKVSR